VAAGQQVRINVLLCMLKGFALARTLCGTNKDRAIKGMVYDRCASAAGGPAHPISVRPRSACQVRMAAIAEKRESGASGTALSRMGSIGRYIIRATLARSWSFASALTALMWITQACATST